MKKINKALVSVIVPVYNVENYLGACLDSILAQSHKNLEIIIVDDKTPDSSGKIADKYAKKDKRITVIHKNNNQGLNRARQTGFKKSTGEYLAFIDSDDILQDNFIERLIGMMEKEKADIGVSGYQFFTDENTIEYSPARNDQRVYDRDESIYYMLTYLTYWPHQNSPLNNVASKLFRRKIINEIDWDFCDYNVGEDDFCSAEFINISQKNVVTDEQLYYYRKANPSSLTANKKAMFKYRGKEISAFELCDDYYMKVSKLLDKKWENEINYRSYVLYKYYVWNLTEHKMSLTTQDIKIFDKLFPVDEFKKIKNHPLDESFLRIINESGLIGYVLEKIKLLTEDRDSVYKQNVALQADYDRMMSIRGSAKQLAGNILRKVRRGGSKVRRKIVSIRNNRSTINKKKVDRELFKRLKHVYDNQDTNIPKIIHYCWMGKNPKPPELIRFIKTWKKHMPDYEIIEWNEKNFDLHYNNYTREAYENKKWAFVSDVVRLYALFYYGGIYLDADVEVLKPLDNFLNHHAFSSFESGDPNNQEPFIPTGLMGSEKRGQWVKELLDYYRWRFFVMPDGQLDMTPNPTPITNHTVEKYHVIRNNKFQDLGAVTIYPSEYFCPKSWKTGKVDITKNTYAIHHFAGSWLSDNNKKR